MKKRWTAVIIAFSMALLSSGCGSVGSDNTETEITEDAAGSGDGTDGVGIEDVLGDMTVEYSEAVAAALSGSWNVEGEEETYVFSADGSGGHGLEGKQEKFQYTCGFDEENNILVQITTEESEETYRISTDETGYRLYMEAAKKDRERKILTPAGLEILETEDEMVSGILGIWVDDSGNRYEFTKDSKFRILTSENNDGTFSAADKKEEMVQEICIRVAGGSLKYEYSLKDDGKTLELYSRDAESFYYWHREE